MKKPLVLIFVLLLTAPVFSQETGSRFQAFPSVSIGMSMATIYLEKDPGINLTLGVFSSYSLNKFIKVVIHPQCSYTTLSFTAWLLQDYSQFYGHKIETVTAFIPFGLAVKPVGDLELWGGVGPRWMLSQSARVSGGGLDTTLSKPYLVAPGENAIFGGEVGVSFGILKDRRSRLAIKGTFLIEVLRRGPWTYYPIDTWIGWSTIDICFLF